MKISSKELEASKVRVIVDKNPVATSFEKWAQPGHFSRTLAKGPKTTTWIWNLHADAHDFDSQTSSLEDISRKIFSAHFGQLSLIFIWISQAYFHGARFSNYSAWLSNPTTVKQSAHVVWPIVGQEILNGDVGGGFSGVQTTSGWFELSLSVCVLLRGSVLPDDSLLLHCSNKLSSGSTLPLTCNSYRFTVCGTVLGRVLQ